MARNPVAIFANGIGDSLLVLPAIRALAEVFNGRLRLVCEQDMGQMFYWALPLRQILPLGSFRKKSHREFDASATAQAIGSADLLISLLPWHSKSVTSLLEVLNVRESIGFFPGFKHTLPLDLTKHSSDLAFDAARALDGGLRFEDFSSPPQYPLACERRADEILGSLPAGARTLFVHGDSLPEKSWPADRFIRVVDRFLKAHSEVVVFDVGWEPTLSALKHSQHLVDASRLRLDLTCALVSRGDLFLGVDSCFLHVADFARVPGVGIFGPTTPDEFGFRFAAHRHIWNRNGVAEVGEEEVFAALEGVTAAALQAAQVKPPTSG